MSPDAPAIAVRLADEGVPLRAIARATGTPSTKVYATLIEAKQDGRLLELPRDDWPPGCPRDQRALQLSRLVTENKPMLLLAVQGLFGITRTQARIVLLMVQHELVPRERVGLSTTCFNVHVTYVRRALVKFGLKVQTLWGYGYQLSPEHRREAMDLILQRAGLPSPAQ
jgi:hypothetical protein